MALTETLLARRDLLALLCAVPAFAKKRNRKDKKKRQNEQEAEPLALIAGSVFQPGGVSFRGVKVFAVSLTNPKLKFEAVSDSRGEFAIRVPAAEAKFKVTAQARGLDPVEREVEVYEAQKTNVNLIFSAPNE